MIYLNNRKMIFKKLNIIDMGILGFFISYLGFSNIPSISYFILLLIIIFTSSKIVFKKVNLIIHPYTKWYILFLLFALTSCVWAVSKERVMVIYLKMLVSFAFIFCLTLNIKKEDDIYKYFSFIQSANIVMCFKLFILTRESGINSIRNIGVDLIGLDKNYFSQIIAFCIIIAVICYYQKKQKIWLIFIPLYLYIIIGSGSRKALLTPFLGIIILIILTSKDSIKKILKNYILIFIVCIIFSFILKNNYELYERIDNLIKSILTDVDSDASFLIRSKLIDLGFELFKSNPIIGVGLNNFSMYSGNINVYGGYMYAHNNYLEIIADLGLIGFILYYYIYIKIFYKSIQCLIRKSRNKTSIYISTILIVLVIIEYGVVSYYLLFYQLLIALLLEMLKFKDEEYNKRNEREYEN